MCGLAIEKLVVIGWQTYPLCLVGLRFFPKGDFLSPLFWEINEQEKET